jgi:hypothetical protein
VARWDPSSAAGSLEELPIDRLLDDRLTLPLSPPLPADALQEWIHQQARNAEEQLSGSWGTFDVTAVELRGDWPEAHVIIRFRARELPTREGAMACPLFDHDGALEIDTGVFADLAQRTPEGAVVWLGPLQAPEGLLPEAE